MKRTIGWSCVAGGVLSAWCAGCAGTAADQRRTFVAALGAHAVCGGYFVVGRDYQRSVDEVIAQDLAPFPLFEWETGFRVVVDREHGTVTVRGDGIPDRVAEYNGDQGCTIRPVGADDVSFTPYEVTSTLPDPSAQPWPTGDVGAYGTVRPAARAALEAALDAALHRTEHNTRALVVVHAGRVVGERYAPGFTKSTPQISWSQGKSLTATLAAVLMEQGHFHWTDPAPVAEWHGAADPRRYITIANLLNMSSGLDFHNYGLGTDSSFTRANEHFLIYFEATNVFDHAIHQPLDIEPNTRMRYRNSDPLTIGRIVRQTVEERGEVYHQFAQTHLFDRIGIRDAVLETDPYGNYIMTGYEYLSAWDWARFGLLYLNDGVWEGERIVPAGWVDFVRTPAPADSTRHYGGMFWLNRGGAMPRVPADAYWPAGFMGQLTIIVPSEQLVVVRLGPSPSGSTAYMNDVVGDVIEALHR